MNMQQIMAQAQRMQKDINKKKDIIDQTSFEGKSDWVKITFMGNKEVKNVEILNDDAFNIENKDILSDMILLAIKDGINKIDAETNKQLGAYAQMGGLF